MKPNLKHTLLATVITFCIFVSCALPASASVLHNFGVLTNVVGLNPRCIPAIGPDGTLYGFSTENDGDTLGVIFKIQPDGSGFTPLKKFTDRAEGGAPRGSLLLVGNVLFGTTYEGGGYGYGSIFKLNTDGSGFTNLHSFVYSIDGARPAASLTVADGALFGTATAGSENGNGTIFRLNTDGTGFTNLYNFSAPVSGINSDGASPQARLLLSGNSLYGTCNKGGLNAHGTVFAIATDGTGFTNLHSFGSLLNYTNGDGADPYGGLTQSGGRIYGTTYRGGAHSVGVVFGLNTDGTDFTNLHDFAYASNNGANSYATLMASGGMLYGTTLYGGAEGQGTVFTLGTNGTGYMSLYSFSNDWSDGAYAYEGVALSGGVLFGSTAYGGNFNSGSLFRINSDGSNFTNLFSFHYSSPDSPNVVLEHNGKLYGTAQNGGSHGGGVIFRVDIDGSHYTNLFDFGPYRSPNMPRAGLTYADNMLFGTTCYGGTYNNGGLFRINLDGSGYTNLMAFHSYISGDLPEAIMVASGHTLYGTASGGGENYNGAIFAINTDGTGFTNLYNFSALSNNTNADGAVPYGELVVSNGWLFGTTRSGGNAGNGTVFAVSTNGAIFTNLHSFTMTLSNTNNDGARSFAGLVLSGNRLYGTASSGGRFGYGTVFALNRNGSGFTNLHDFSHLNAEGYSPYTTMLLSGNKLYGTTYSGGEKRYGTIFTLNTNGSDYNDFYSFNYTDGGNPDLYSGLIMSDNTIYGTTPGGGELGNGVVFALNLPAFLSIQPLENAVVLSWTTPNFSLQSAPKVSGVYTNVTGATSPYTNTITDSQEYFRLKAN